MGRVWAAYHPICMWIDNAAAVAFIRNRGLVRSNLRHIDCRLNWVQTLHDASVVEPQKVPTQFNYSDIGTKLLDFARLSWLRSRWYHRYPLFSNATLEFDEPIETTPHVDTIEEIEALLEQHAKFIQEIVAKHYARL